MQKCQECGLVHPFAPKGQCPVARAERLETTEKGKKIVEFTSKLSTYLVTANDYEYIINEINKLIGE